MPHVTMTFSWIRMRGIGTPESATSQLRESMIALIRNTSLQHTLYDYIVSCTPTLRCTKEHHDHPPGEDPGGSEEGSGAPGGWGRLKGEKKALLTQPGKLGRLHVLASFSAKT